MPKVAKELSALEVKRLVHPGDTEYPVSFSVGGISGLALQLTPHGGRSWLLRYTVNGKRKEMGLGPYPEVSLADAREAARAAKAQARAGVDPLAERAAKRAEREAEQRRSLTFADAVKTYCDTKLDGMVERHRVNWRQSLTTYAVPVLGNMPIADIETRDVLQVIEPIWRTKTRTASNVRGRMEKLLDWATVCGYRTGDNPARWRGNLKELLPDPGKIAKVKHRPALAVTDAAQWFADLQEQEGRAAPALIFTALTAARAGEVLGATWDEIQGDVWVIPADRMKMSREHRVPLSGEALALLERQPRENELVFPGARGSRMRDYTMSDLMREVGDYRDPSSGEQAVPHGLRATFRQWCAEKNYPRDLAEAALAHQVGSAVERAYQRSDVLERRRAMMQSWADFLKGKKSGNVVKIA